MSTMACEIIGTGDGKLKDTTKNEETLSKTIAKDMVIEIIDNALDIVDDTSDVTIPKIMNQIPVQEYSEKYGKGLLPTKEKSAAPLIGTGDQRSSEGLKTEEPVPYHPPVEKKNRLTDLVKNSKQILARIMMSESKMALQEEKKGEEKVVEVIELDCVEISDLPFKSKHKMLPEEVPLPKNDSQDILAPPPSDEVMDEIGLSPAKEETKETPEKKRMTFPRASGSRAKAAFASKCRTLKREATNLRKKKWDVSERIANFFRKKRDSVKGNEAKSEETQKHNTTEKSIEKEKECNRHA